MRMPGRKEGKRKNDCLTTRWPEAVPLRTITARSVAEGLWSIFVRTSIPERILTDQGSQFCSRLVKELCALIGIEKVQTSPYHPQTNGAVERMHGTFKAILGKCKEAELDWVGQVNFVLFVLRQIMPIRVLAHSTWFMGLESGLLWKHCTMGYMRWNVGSWVCV